MIGMPASDTGEHGLYDSVLRRDMPTLSTRLRRVLRRYGDDFATPPELLVFQHTAEHAPALIENRLVQPGLGRDVSARFLDRAFGRPGHI